MMTGPAGGEVLSLGPPFPAIKSDDSEQFEKLLFTKLIERKFFQAGKPMSQDLENKLQTAWQARIAQRGGGQHSEQHETTALILVTDKTIEITVPFEWGLSRGTPAKFTVAKLKVVSMVPKLIENLQEARRRGKENPDQEDPTKHQLLLDQPAREWRVVALESGVEAIAPPTRQKN